MFVCGISVCWSVCVCVCVCVFNSSFSTVDLGLK